MTRREFFRRGVSAGGAVLAAPMIGRGRFQLFAGTGGEYSTRTVELIQSSIVVDMLGLLTLDWNRLQRWESSPDALTEEDWRKLRSSGITVFHPAVSLPAPGNHEATREWLCALNRFLDWHPDKFIRVEKAADFARAKCEGKIGVLLGMQDGCHFRSAADIPAFYGIGQRISQITYNARNPLGCGCKEPRDGGLTPYGACAIREMNRTGMAVDLSHAGERTALDGIDASSKPVLITHTNCRALVPGQPRCETDRVIRKLASRGGVMGITGVRRFVRNQEPTTLANALDHFDHVVRLVGIEHVGIGSDNDLDGRDRSKARRRYDIAGLDHPQRIYDLTEGLVRRGYKNADISLILGGNFHRVLSEILHA